MPQTSPDTGWFIEARFGLFVHFGLYSIVGRHEWVRSYEEIGDEEYRRYVEFFEPDQFDARALAKLARSTGMKYVVLTTKHHEGFCLWDSKLTDFTATRRTGRDLIAEFVEAVRAEGLKVGFYHSLIDWSHPDFTIDYIHPLRGAEDVEALNAPRDMGRYRAYLHSQVRELLTGYGQIDLMFYDFTYPDARDGFEGKGPEAWDAEALLALTRELQPGIIVNNRLGLPGDYMTPEQYQPERPLLENGVEVVWEACQTVNGSWGYHRDNHDAKDPGLLLRMLIQSVSANGNVILNVGPNGRGRVEPSDRAIFEKIGEWMELHADSIHGAGASSYTPPHNGLYTQRGNRLYLHLLSWPMTHVHLPGLAGKVRHARLLNDGAELKTTVLDQAAPEHIHLAPERQPEGTLTVTLPIRQPDGVLVPVIELFLDE